MAKDRTCANGEGMSRRSLLISAPAAGLASCVPAAASAATDTPVMRKFREWLPYYKAINVQRTHLTEQEVDALLDRQGEIEHEILMTPSTCAADFAAKVASYSSFGLCYLPDRTGPLWDEARALMGELDTAAPIAAPAPVSPMRALYHEWRTSVDAFNNYEGDDREHVRQIYGRIRALEDQASAYDPKTMEDLAFMIVIADDGGDMDTTPEQNALAETAYRITGVGPRR